MKVPLLDLDAQYKPLMDQIRANMEEVFKTHRYILGPQVKEFEDKLAEYCRADHAVGCASGTDALVLALKALEIRKGDEVITTPFTFFATASCINRVGAKPVFADINTDTFNLDPDKIKAAITSRTKAIIVVHLFGQPSEMDRIMEIADRYGLKVIEDNAQGIGSSYDGKIAGNFGDISTISFFPSKNLGAMGDAGMCTTNNKKLADRIRCLRHHGENPKYFHKWIGLNSRLDTLQAAILLAKLPHLENWTRARIRNADYYYRNMDNIPEIQLPFIHEKAESIFNQFTLKVEKRDDLLEHLQKNGIGCAIYYPQPLHIQECFSYLGHHKGDFPGAEKVAKEVISIPVYSELTESQQDYIIGKIKEFYQ